MKAARRLGALTLLLTCTILWPGPKSLANESFPQAKINYVDATQAPKMKVFVSFLDKRLRPVNFEKYIKEVIVSKKPEKQKPVELFRFVEGEPVFPKAEGEEAAEGEEEEEPEGEPPVLTLMQDEEVGAAVVVVTPGFASPELRDGTLGQRMKEGGKLFFSDLASANRMNVLWYSDSLRSYVRSKGRTRELSQLRQLQDKCDKWAFEKAREEKEGEEEEEEDKPLEDDEAYCGLHDDPSPIADIVPETPYGGFFPHLFGLRHPLCRKPQHPHSVLGEVDVVFDPDEPAAMDVAIEMLMADAAPGQPRYLILLGDGKDGYIHKDTDCRNQATDLCKKKIERGEKRRRTKIKQCINKYMERRAIKEQQRFAQLLPKWINAAKAANIRIYSVANPTATAAEKQRLEILALRTGGTYREAEDANQVTELMNDLILELNEQIVVTFTDEEALPSTQPVYRVDIKVGSRKFSAGTYEVKVADQLEGMAVMIRDFRKFGEDKLGPTGFMAALIGVGLILLLILYKLIFKPLLKKIKPPKAPKAPKGAKLPKGPKIKKPKAPKAPKAPKMPKKPKMPKM